MPALQTEVLITVDGVEHSRHVVEQGEYVIGRNPECHIRVKADLVSRQHAKLTVNSDHVLIEDLDSSNGTFISGQLVTEPTRLWPEQKIQLGAAIVTLRRLPGEQPTDLSLTPAQEAVRRLLPAEILQEKKYEVGPIVAQGGMGAILDVRDAVTERRVAMKVMLNGSDPDDLTRFVGEAKVTAQLEHPSIVPIYELSVDEKGQPFYTMKMVRGITLKKVLELLAQGNPETVKQYPLSALLTVFQKVCDALAFAHSKGVIHRDLKPENIMLDDFGVVLVMDWGLAKIIGKGDAPGADAPRNIVRTLLPEASGSTLAGSIMGTPQYMSPEQARGEVEALDARSDIYALGAILYHILALRPPVTGDDAWAIVEKVAKAQVEPLTAPKDRALPDSLAAVVRKAMSLGRSGRYENVAALQRDIEAYQGGFATSAENAGPGKHLLLALRRHKIATAGIVAVLLVGATLGTKAVVEGRRAGREAMISKRALADLKASAPALLQLAVSEADSQRFASALGKLDAALALDPALLRARWQRAWVLLALERWSEAGDALRLAQQHDPAGAKLASILPAVEKVAATPEPERWKGDAAREVFAHLQTVEATGPALAFAEKLKLSAEDRYKIADQRLLAALGRGNYSVSIGNNGLIAVNVAGKPLKSLEAIRGLPIESLDAGHTLISNLEPLRGMRLQVLVLEACKAINDLTPLHGMPLRSLIIRQTEVRDLGPLSGMRLSRLEAQATQVVDLTPLAGMPLTDLALVNTSVSRIDALRGMPLASLDLVASKVVDFSPLKGAPLQNLHISGSRIPDLSFVKGMPLRSLIVLGSVSDIEGLRGLPLENLELVGSAVTDLTPLRGAPLKELNIRGCKNVTDYTPVLTLSRLERLHCDVLPAALLPLRGGSTLQTIEADAYPGESFQGARPVAEFWRAYDAHRE